VMGRHWFPRAVPWLRGPPSLQQYFSIAKKYLAPESSAATSPMSFRPLSGFRRLINLSIPSKHNASRWLAS
jgi:hypothetical protein